MVALFAATLASLVIGHPVPVECGPLPGHMGWYDQAHDRIVIADWLCPHLEADPSKGGIVLQRFAYAALVVVHEAEHAAGIRDEHEANCEAVRDLKPLLKLLRVPKATAIVSYAKQVAQNQAPPYGGKCRK